MKVGNRKLTSAEAEQANEVLDHVEQLINMRGRFSGEHGLFEGFGFTVRVGPTRTGYDILVTEGARNVCRAHWDDQSDPGSIVMRPGDWQGRFLALPTAHA